MLEVLWINEAKVLGVRRIFVGHLLRGLLGGSSIVGVLQCGSDRRIVEDEAQNRYGSQHGAGMEGMNQIPQGEYCGDCPCKNEGFSGLYCGYFRKFVRYVSLKDKYQRLPECLKRRPFIKDQGE